MMVGWREKEKEGEGPMYPGMSRTSPCHQSGSEVLNRHETGSCGNYYNPGHLDSECLF
jgi:hypothetical protein